MGTRATRSLIGGVVVGVTISALGVLPAPLASAAGSEVGTSSARPAAATRIRVGSFNIRNVRHDAALFRGEAPWRLRRAAIVADILGESVDVLGLQEASQNVGYRRSLVSGASTQYLDLRNGLNARGGAYRLTDARPGTSRDTRIIYDTTTMAMVRQGHYEYAAQSRGENDQRYLVWAVFREKASGKRFFFANTRLVNTWGNLQRAQWHELIDKVNDLRGDLPTIVVGDFQRSKFKNPAAEMMLKMRRAGYGDVVGQLPMSALRTGLRARRLSRGWINSVNGFNRDVSDWSFETDRKKLGNNCDWIFASNKLPVLKWKVVADIDPRTLRLQGVIPSDHNMVRATIELV